MKRVILIIITLVIFILCSCSKPDAFNSKIVKKFKWEGFKVQKIYFKAFDDTRVSSYLFLPRNTKEKRPCVLAIHGLTNSKENWMSIDGYTKGGNVTKTLLNAGYAVFALDSRFHGENYTGDDKDEQREFVVDNKYEYFFATLDDYKRAIDYLEIREEINKDRIGVIGYSSGGTFTFGLANRDKRLKAAIACVPPIIPTLKSPTETHMNYQNITDTPMLMLMGKKDSNYITEDARMLFDQLPVTEKDIIFFNAGHSLPVEYTESVLEWFDKYL